MFFMCCIHYWMFIYCLAYFLFSPDACDDCRLVLPACRPFFIGCSHSMRPVSVFKWSAWHTSNRPLVAKYLRCHRHDRSRGQSDVLDDPLTGACVAGRYTRQEVRTPSTNPLAVSPERTVSRGLIAESSPLYVGRDPCSYLAWATDLAPPSLPFLAPLGATHCEDFHPVTNPVLLSQSAFRTPQFEPV